MHVTALLACPACRGVLSDALVCVSCGEKYEDKNDIPDLRVPSEARTETVRDPNTLTGAEPLEGPELFVPAEDNWGLENWFAQIGRSMTIGYEGGLFVTIGRSTAPTD